MNEKKLTSLLAILALCLSLAISVVGITTDHGGDPYVVTSLRGEAVQVYGGYGPYRYDSVYKAVVLRGYDWVNFVALPLFLLGLSWYRRDQLRGRLLLAAVFCYFAWNYLIAAMGNGFNGLFLLYVALCSTGLYGLYFTLKGLDLSSLPERLGAGFPRRSLAIYVMAAGLVLLFEYVAQVLSAYLAGAPPVQLSIYTTLELAALELGLTIPIKIAGAVLLWRRRSMGYVIATLIVVVAALTFLALNASHLLLYFSYQGSSLVEIAELVAFAAISIGFTVIVFKRMEEKQSV